MKKLHDKPLTDCQAVTRADGEGRIDRGAGLIESRGFSTAAVSMQWCAVTDGYCAGQAAAASRLLKKSAAPMARRRCGAGNITSCASPEYFNTPLAQFDGTDGTLQLRKEAERLC